MANAMMKQVIILVPLSQKDLRACTDHGHLTGTGDCAYSWIWVKL